MEKKTTSKSYLKVFLKKASQKKKSTNFAAASSTKHTR